MIWLLSIVRAQRWLALVAVPAAAIGSLFVVAGGESRAKPPPPTTTTVVEKAAANPLAAPETPATVTTIVAANPGSLPMSSEEQAWRNRGATVRSARAQAPTGAVSPTIGAAPSAIVSAAVTTTVPTTTTLTTTTVAGPGPPPVISESRTPVILLFVGGLAVFGVVVGRRWTSRRLGDGRQGVA